MGTNLNRDDEAEFLDDNLCGELNAQLWGVIEKIATRPFDTQAVAVNDNSRNRLKNTLVPQRGVLANLHFSCEMPGSLKPVRTGIFFDSITLSTPATTHAKEKDVNQEKEADDFHDSDDEDVYDLFLAVNGETKDGFLDISKLDQLTPDEAEILNAPRLREIWDHTKTGCLKCKEIIRTLNIVRNALRKEADDNIAALNNVKIDQSTSH